MAVRSKEILLKIRGDATDAKRALADTRANLERLGREQYEARLDVNERVVLQKIDRVKERLDHLSAQEASPAVDVKVASAYAQLDRLNLRLDRLKARRVSIDVVTDRSVASRIERFGEGLRSTGGAAISARPAMVGLAAVLAGALASGLGAVAIAAAGAATALGLLGLGVVERFKQQAKKAGTAANDLKRNLKSFTDVFGRATAGGADAIFRSLSAALQTLGPAVQALTGSFTTLGTAVGSAFQTLASKLAQPAMVQGMRTLIEGTAKLMPSLARLGGALAQTFLALSNAAMPFLRAGTTWLANVVQKFADWASSKTGTDKIQAFLTSLVPLFKSLASFGKNLGGTFFATLQATAPILPALVKALSSILGVFNALPGPIRGTIGAIALLGLTVKRSGLGDLIGTLTKLARRFGLLSGAATAAEEAAGPAGASIGSKLVGGFRGIVGRLGSALQRALATARSGAAGLAQGLGERLGTLLSGAFGGRLRGEGGILARLKGLLGRGGAVFGALGGLAGTLGAVLGAGLVGALIGTLLNKIPFIRHAAQSVAAAVMGQSDLGRRDKTTNNAFDSYTNALAKLDREHNAGKLSDAEWYRRRKQLTNSLQGNFGTGYMLGGLVRRAFGGIVPGSGRGDTVPAMLEPGEFVLRRSVVQALSLPVLHALNGGAVPAMATGGGAPVIHNHHWTIPQPMDAMKSIDSGNLAALIQQEWTRRGGGLS